MIADIGGRCVRFPQGQILPLSCHSETLAERHFLLPHHVPNTLFQTVALRY
jgi:hypothetical protein